jgi:hypothetical protein
MAQPLSLLQQARAFARDYPRDNMPKGYLWDVLDYVPLIVDAPLSGRGGWRWNSSPLGGDIEAGIYAQYVAGAKLLVQASDGHLYEIPDDGTYTAVDKGVVPRSRQNPIQVGDIVVHFDRDGLVVPTTITAPGGTTTIGSLDASAPKARYGTIYKTMIVAANAPGQEDVVRFSTPGSPTGAWDTNSFVRTSRPVSAIAALRSAVIIFHAGQVERIRGTIPPHGTETGDMFLEQLFDRIGCDEPQTIAYWNDNCIFADQHGVHMTDGAIVRNLASQGGISYYWRVLYTNKLSVAGQVFLDFYIITIRRDDGTDTTLVCDLNRRQWFRFTNIPAISYIASAGAPGIERLWAGLSGTSRLAAVSACFQPTFTIVGVQDDNNVPVLPQFETPWYRMGQEGRKRQRFAYLSYDSRLPAGVTDQAMQVEYIDSPELVAYTNAGRLPGTDRYRRYRVPVGRYPYGIAFRVKQITPMTALRVYDLAVDAQATERSRT